MTDARGGRRRRAEGQKRTSPPAPRADSAGVPFEGRHFEPNPSAADDGSAPPKLLEAIRRFRAREVGVAEVVAALHDVRLLIPLLAVRGEEGIGAHGRPVDKTQELSIVTVEGPDGRAVLPAFTSVAALSAWDPAARPIPIEAPRVALAAASEGTSVIMLDPGSPTEFAVRRPAFRAIATGEGWIPSFDDERVLDAFLEATAREEPVRLLQLAPGDPDAGQAGPELLVQLSLRDGLDQQELSALLARLQERWAADPVIAERVDSIALRLDRLA